MWRVYNLHHTSVFTYSHANTPLGQSERAYYLSYFINSYGHGLLDFKSAVQYMKYFIYHFTFLEHLKELSGQISIGGDANLLLDNTSNNQTSEFLELLDTLNMSQVMNRPSHRLGHTLDYIITEQGVNLEDDICVPTPGISDHILLAFKFSVQKPTLSHKTVITRDRKSLHLEQLNYDIIRTGFRHSYHDFSECVHQYDNKLRTLLDVHAPRAGKPS